MSLANIIIFLFTITATFGIALRSIGEHLGFEVPELVHFYVYVPAVTLASFAWLTRPHFLRSWPFLFATALPLLGLTYGESPTWGTNAVIAFYLISGVATAAFLAEQDRWQRVARLFVLANAVFVFLIFWLNYRATHGSIPLTVIKFGCILLPDMSRSANSNQVGGQFAFVAVTGVVLFLRSGRLVAHQSTPLPWGDPPALVEGNKWLGSPLGTDSRWRVDAPSEITSVSCKPSSRFEFGKADWPILAAATICALGCFLTASRGATLGLLVGIISAVFGSLGLQPIRRLRDFVVFAILSFLIGTFTAATLSVNPLEPLSRRVFGSEGSTLVTAGSRLPIWENAFLAWLDDPVRFLVGAGTGGADVALGKLDPGAKFDEHGTIRRSCHNIFIEWVLSYGLVGILPGTVLVLVVWSQAATLDRRELAFDRRALLLTVAVLGMTGVVYRYISWPVMAAITLALLENRTRPPAPPGMRRGHAPHWTPEIRHRKEIYEVNYRPRSPRPI